MRPARRSIALLSVLLLHAAAPMAAAGERIAEAARTRDQAALRVLLRRGADVNAPQVDGTTALHWAAHWSDLEVASVLLTAGANANAVNRYGSTPLSLAAENADAAMIGRLLDAGANPNSASSGRAVIALAARTGSVQAVKLLIARGADVNAREEWREQTPLMWAAAEDHADVVTLLVESGAAVDVETPGGFTALMFAARQGSLAAARALVEGGARVDDVYKGRSAMSVALINKNYELAAYLLGQGAGVRPAAGDMTEMTPLHHLILARNPGNDVRKTVTGSMSSLDMMKALLAAGADPNARKARESRGATDEQNLAIDNGVNLGGATPFLLAAKSGDVEAMRLLLASGADPRLTTFEHSTALLLAAGVGFVENSDAGMRTEDEFIETVNVLLGLGLDVTLTNDQHQSVLHGAVYRGMNRLLQRLLDRGAVLDVEDEQGRTPLALARAGFNQLGHIRREEQVSLLRQKGAR